MIFSKNFTQADEVFRSGKGPYSGTLGPNRTADALRDGFVADLKKNPGYANFYSNRTFADIAPQSQAKIDAASKTDEPSFDNPGDQSFASAFLKNYQQGISRGLVAPKEAITSDRLANISSEAAAAASMEKDPNTLGKFPSQGVM